MSEYCHNCAARNSCGAAVAYGSICCMVNRMRSGQTKGDFVGASKEKPRYCAYCGQPLREIGNKRFCNNVQCRNRYNDV